RVDARVRGRHLLGVGEVGAQLGEQNFGRHGAHGVLARGREKATPAQRTVHVLVEQAQHLGLQILGCLSFAHAHFPLVCARACTACNDCATLAAGGRSLSTAATLPSGATMKVVRSTLAWWMATPFWSVRPGALCLTTRSKAFETLPSTSDATATLPAQYSGSAENSLSRSMRSC